jgi:hypothetical protein
MYRGLNRVADFHEIPYSSVQKVVEQILRSVKNGSVAAIL